MHFNYKCYLEMIGLSKTFLVLSWKDLLPEVINVLVEREVVEHNGIEITGIEYKAQVINSLCVMQWSANIITTLAAMFG